MSIKTEMLRCFVAVANSGNLSDAASKLGRTPSAVSMMLKQFEDHLGTPLFESERKSKLTALGVFTLEQATRELAHFERTVGAIESYAQAKSGELALAVVPSVAEAILPDILQEFLADHPDVQVDIRDMDSAAVLRELENERVDLGIATGPENSSEFDCEPLFSDDFGIVCPGGHPLLTQKAVPTWLSLLEYPFIANGICTQISDPAVHEALNNSRLMVRNTTSLLALVRAGVGITVLPRLVVDRVSDDVAFLPVADQSAKRRIDMIYRKLVRLSPAAQRFQEIVRTHWRR